MYQISRLLRRPYSPASFNSASKRAASKGLDRAQCQHSCSEDGAGVGIPSRDRISLSRHC